MLTYRENNIEFRIASATALSEFKAVQAHSFIQVCRKEFEFTHAAREVVLLSYDRFSQWLLKMERAFLLEEKKYPSTSLKQLIYSTFVEELGYIEEICQTHQSIFNPEILDYLKLIHKYTRQLIADIFTKNLLQPSHKAFVDISSSTSEYLQHLLLAMHEFNNNIHKKREPFVCVGRFCLLPANTKLVSLSQRAAYFKDRLGRTLTLKNYTDAALDEDVIRLLDEQGVCAEKEVELTA